jgi:Transglycosylase SLT domain
VGPGGGMMRHASLPFRSFLGAVALLTACSDGVAPQTREPPAAANVALDPVSAAVAEASQRFGVPERWIRAVMRVESAGRVDAVSRAGAMGLMQVMPGTYAELRARYRLGADPFAIRDNVMAGTAYLREMFDRYGATGMLAAYNAGPGRWEAYRAGVRPLPAETVGYLARLRPMLDIAAVPGPPIRVVSPAPSPLEAPLFVGSDSSASAGSATPDEQLVRTVVAENSVVALSGGDIFVRRVRASEIPRPTSQALDASNNGSAPAAATQQPAGLPQPVRNPLFPARSGEVERP